MKNSKALRSDGVLCKVGRHTTRLKWDLLCDLVRNVYDKERMLPAWREGVVCLFIKENAISRIVKTTEG